MKKTLITLLALCGLVGFTSCGNLTWSQVQTQIASIFTLDSTVAVIVSDVLAKHPDSIDLFKKIADDLTKLSEKDVLTLEDIKADIENRIEDAQLPYSTEIVKVVDKIFDKISSDPTFDIVAHRQELLDIISGIEWAVAYAESKNPALKPLPEPEEAK